MLAARNATKFYSSDLPPDLDTRLVSNVSLINFLFSISPARSKFRWCLVIQRRMWTALVIILPPVINRFHGVNNIAEPVLIQAFIANASVKTINKSVLGRLARLDKPQLHAMFKGPLIKCAAGKLRPLVSSYRRRIAAKQRDAVRNTRDLSA